MSRSHNRMSVFSCNIFVRWGHYRILFAVDLINLYVWWNKLVQDANDAPILSYARTAVIRMLDAVHLLIRSYVDLFHANETVPT